MSQLSFFFQKRRWASHSEQIFSKTSSSPFFRLIIKKKCNYFDNYMKKEKRHIFTRNSFHFISFWAKYQYKRWRSSLEGHIIEKITTTTTTTRFLINRYFTRKIISLDLSLSLLTLLYIFFLCVIGFFSSIILLSYKKKWKI